ncbi:MAG: hypothetical protein NUW37_11405 [Planctomycetes bacterium]|nr:hypothetical protein [Planctomycetota bacterium]
MNEYKLISGENTQQMPPKLLQADSESRSGYAALESTSSEVQGSLNNSNLSRNQLNSALPEISDSDIQIHNSDSQLSERYGFNILPKSDGLHMDEEVYFSLMTECSSWQVELMSKTEEEIAEIESLPDFPYYTGDRFPLSVNE